MAKKRWALILFTALTAVFAAGSTVRADSLDAYKPAGYSDVSTDVGGVISGGVQWMFTIASILLLFYLLWGGLDWLTAGGDKGKVESAIGKIRNAIIGIIVVASSWAIYSVVMYVAFGKDVTSGEIELETPSLK